jgi:SAM-dependent methyltransferase
VLDLGCGAGRNAIQLARLGWKVLGSDLSWPMFCAAAQRAREDAVGGLGTLIAALPYTTQHGKPVEHLLGKRDRLKSPRVEVELYDGADGDAAFDAEFARRLLTSEGDQ